MVRLTGLIPSVLFDSCNAMQRDATRKERARMAKEKKNHKSSLLTTEQVAERLKVSVSSVTHWRCGNEPSGPPFQRIGRSIRYDAESLRQWQEQKTVKH